MHMHLADLSFIVLSSLFFESICVDKHDVFWCKLKADITTL